MVSNYAFSGCSGLQSIDLPSCKCVGNGAFSMCTKLQNVNIPTCEIIYDGAFYQCASLNSIFLSNCYSIGSSAFQRCYRLLSVYLLGSSVASIKAAVFTSTPISGYTAQTGGVVGSIFVPSSLYSAYISAQNWSAFANRITSYVEE